MSPVDDEQVPLVGGPELGDIYSVGIVFCFRMPDLRRLDEEADELMGSDDPGLLRGVLRVYIREEVGSGSGCFGGTSCDSRGETCDTQTHQCFIGE